ncbi:hypothetical protein GEMRC1_003495 [Eukaryota sp. GEM-RC1]
MVSNSGALLSQLDSSTKPKFLNMRGDHSTLLNIFNTYLTKSSSDRNRWCRDIGLDPSILDDARVAFDHLTDTLSRLGYPVQDKIDTTKGDIHDHITWTLCSTFFNNLGVFKEAGNVSKQFVMFDESDLASVEQVDPNRNDSVTLALSHSSLQFWKDEELSPNANYIVFSSLMSNVTHDPETREKTFKNSINFVSFCTTEDLVRSSPQWRAATLEKQLQKFSRVRFDIPITPDQQRLLLSNRGEHVKILKQQIKRADIRITKSATGQNQVSVSCPSGVKHHVERRVGEYLDSQKPEVIVFKNLEGVDFGKFIGKKRSAANDLEAKLDKTLESMVSKPSKVKLDIISNQNELRVTIPNIPPQFTSVIVGLVQSALASCVTGTTTVDLSNISSSGSFSQHLNQNPRLLKLVSSVVPRPNDNNRNNWVLLVAHVAIWEIGLSLYGGFVRDYVIRNQPANDVDCLVPPSLMGKVPSMFKQALSKYNISCGSPRTKGNAHCIDATLPDGSNLEIDLTPSDMKIQKPYVDADINNLMVDKTGLLQKIKGAGGSLCNLAVSIQHCQNKEFVFFYSCQVDPKMCERRLKKMLGKGFTCLSPLPSSMTRKLTNFNQLLKPDKQFDVKFDNLPPHLQLP